MVFVGLAADISIGLLSGRVSSILRRSGRVACGLGASSGTGFRGSRRTARLRTEAARRGVRTAVAPAVLALPALGPVGGPRILSGVLPNLGIEGESPSRRVPASMTEPDAVRGRH
ncbi:hypothetical protein [Streptomyces sp. NPDC048438]|uniref:hypothetical protein n=1 Tax=Streptomyces sp. NPDC048438 TaxID=3365551 RepID=UPI00371B8D4D